LIIYMSMKINKFGSANISLVPNKKTIGTVRALDSND
jgi:hypothetical protein